MRKLVVQTFVSLDGVMQAPGAPDEDRDGGFEHGGWVVPHMDDHFMEFIAESTKKVGALLLGRKTYDIFAASWPMTGDDDPIGSILNSVPKYVASRTLDSVEWNNSTLINGDIADEVARLKQHPGGEIQVHGSGELIQTLLRHDLVDEYRLAIFPVLIGSGKRLFGNDTLPKDLKLVDTVTTSTGVTISTYERHGDLTYGSFGPEFEETN